MAGTGSSSPFALVVEEPEPRLGTRAGVAYSRPEFVEGQDDAVFALHMEATHVVPPGSAAIVLAYTVEEKNCCPDEPEVVPNARASELYASVTTMVAPSAEATPRGRFAAAAVVYDVLVSMFWPLLMRAMMRVVLALVPHVNRAESPSREVLPYAWLGPVASTHAGTLADCTEAACPPVVDRYSSTATTTPLVRTASSLAALSGLRKWVGRLVRVAVAVVLGVAVADGVLDGVEVTLAVRLAVVEEEIVPVGVGVEVPAEEEKREIEMGWTSDTPTPTIR